MADNPEKNDEIWEQLKAEVVKLGQELGEEGEPWVTAVLSHIEAAKYTGSERISPIQFAVKKEVLRYSIQFAVKKETED